MSETLANATEGTHLGRSKVAGDEQLKEVTSFRRPSSARATQILHELPQVDSHVRNPHGSNSVIGGRLVAPVKHCPQLETETGQFYISQPLTYFYCSLSIDSNAIDAEPD